MRIYSTFAVVYLISCMFYSNKDFGFLIRIIGLTACFIAVYRPLLTLFITYRSYKSNKALQETITTTFTDDEIKKVGESFSLSFKLDNIYQVKILRNWVLFYQSKTPVNFIGFKTEDKSNIETLKNFVEKRNIKHNW
ncbi:hypothetical protein HDF24_22335 [Mucilaginibacter sp. X4EP1]|uniref:hypothetical protein n=1 Tax=Mucilaginibacter sp. X4EP1 TaxID=2723092 RepID=UPI00216864B8|nr:hypothetical protein [Mucilaginibacter sp. X4EP1]